MRIEKKTVPELFEKIISCEKNFELRLADWKCSPGDILILKEWDPVKKEFTGRFIEKEVSFILKTKDLNFFSKKDIEKYGFQVISFK